MLLEKHCTSSKNIGPVPEPKKALPYGIPAAEFSKIIYLGIKSETGNVSMEVQYMHLLEV